MSTNKEKVCHYCRENSTRQWVYKGYYFPKKHPEDNKCYYCGNELEDIVLTNDEVNDIYCINRSNPDLQFLEAMIELKEKDPIEFQLKMQQFRTQTAQQKQIKQQESNKNVVKCPKCKSTSITTGARGVNFMWGLIGASKTVNRCANCGHTWKP